MKIGDRVKLTAEAQRNFTEFSLGTIAGIEKGSIYPIKVDFDDDEDWQGGPMPVRESEIELIEEERLPVGTRVRCINNSMYHGREGTITRNDGPEKGYPYFILFDEGKKPQENWSTDGFKVIESPVEEEEDLEVQTIIDDLQDRVRMLEDATKFAENVFLEYAEQHLAKGRGGLFKAQTNIGFATVMANARRTD